MATAADYLAALPGCLDRCTDQMADVDPATVEVRPAPRWLPRIRSGEFAAITLPWAVYVAPGFDARSPVSSAEVIAHELVHVDQWRRLGRFRYARRYLGEYLKNRLRGMGRLSAYLEISHEREARAITTRIVG